MPKTYCEKCEKMCEYIISEPVWEEQQIDDVFFHAYQKHAHCVECGEEVEPAEISVYNVEEANDAYREAIGSISVKDIQAILDRYHIAKEALSLLLGWGANTVARQMKHNVPTREHAARLKSLLDPYVMRELLAKNGNVLTPVALRKANEAVDSIIEAMSYGSFQRNIVCDLFSGFLSHKKPEMPHWINNVSQGAIPTPYLMDDALAYAEAV